MLDIVDRGSERRWKTAENASVFKESYQIKNIKNAGETHAVRLSRILIPIYVFGNDSENTAQSNRTASAKS